MQTTRVSSLKPRKRPEQERSTHTVGAIYEATAQVLVECGLEHFGTDVIARRAGVSIGTLYQYFPNKQALLYSLLERFLDARDEAVEQACEALEGAGLRVLVSGIVSAYVEAKLARPDLAAALYAAALETGASAIVKRTTERCCKAISKALSCSTGRPASETDFPAVTIFSSMAETSRAVLQLGATPQRVSELKEHLSTLCFEYLQVWIGKPA